MALAQGTFYPWTTALSLSLDPHNPIIVISVQGLTQCGLPPACILSYRHQCSHIFPCSSCVFQIKLVNRMIWAFQFGVGAFLFCNLWDSPLAVHLGAIPPESGLLPAQQ